MLSTYCVPGPGLGLGIQKEAGAKPRRQEPRFRSGHTHSGTAEQRPGKAGFLEATPGSSRRIR